MELPRAIQQTHYPYDEQSKEAARKRLAFDELFLIQLGVQARKRDWQQGQPGNVLKAGPYVIEEFLGMLPFHLTSAQQRVLEEIMDDLSKPTPMSRLLQGEVGSGKTVIAVAALLVAIASGFQAALMAPTEALALQHAERLLGHL